MVVMRRRDTALAVLVALVWGTNFVAVRTGLDSVPPLLFLAVRFVVVCVPAVFFVRRPGMPWRDLALIGLFTSLGQFALLYLALHLGMPPGLSSLVLQAQVLVTVVIAAVWLRERPSTAQRVGVALGGAGLLTIAVGRGLSAPLLPLLVLVLAAVSWAVGNVLTRRAGALTAPGAGLGVTVWSGLVVPVPALALSFAFEGPEAISPRPHPRPVARHRVDGLHGVPLLTGRLRDLEHAAQPSPGRAGDAVRDARAGLRHGGRGGGLRGAAEHARGRRRRRPAGRRGRRGAAPPPSSRDAVSSLRPVAPYPGMVAVDVEPAPGPPREATDLPQLSEAGRPSSAR